MVCSNLYATLVNLDHLSWQSTVHYLHGTCNVRSLNIVYCEIDGVGVFHFRNVSLKVDSHLTRL